MEDPLEGMPSVETLAAMLRDLMTIGLHQAEPEEVAGLLELHAVRRFLLADHELSALGALYEQVLELIPGVRDDLLRKLAPFAFGTEDRIKDLGFEDRLRAASSVGIYMSYSSYRQQKAPELAHDMAGRLHWLETRIRYNGWLERPYDPTHHDETLRQYDFFSSMAFWLNGAALDAAAALTSWREDDEEAFEGSAYSALWRWTRFLRTAHRFDVQFFGVWGTIHLTDDERHDAIRAQYDAEVLAPLLPQERSLLRVQVAVARYEELEPFIALLRADETGQSILELWEGWIKMCECDLDHPAPEECGLHRFFDEARSVFELMNKEIGQPHMTDRAARFQTLPDVYET